MKKKKGVKRSKKREPVKRREKLIEELKKDEEWVKQFKSLCKRLVSKRVRFAVMADPSLTLDDLANELFLHTWKAIVCAKRGKKRLTKSELKRMFYKAAHTRVVNLIQKYAAEKRCSLREAGDGFYKRTTVSIDELVEKVSEDSNRKAEDFIPALSEDNNIERIVSLFFLSESFKEKNPSVSKVLEVIANHSLPLLDAVMMVAESKRPIEVVRLAREVLEALRSARKEENIVAGGTKQCQLS